MDMQGSHGTSAQTQASALDAETIIHASIEGMADIMVCGVDRMYRYVYFNSAYQKSVERTYGTIPEEGKTILDCITVAKDATTIRANIDRALTGKKYVVIQEDRADAGEYFETRYNPVMTPSNEVVGVVVFSMNIGGRLASDKARHDTEERFNAFMDATPAVAWVKDLNGRLLYVNKTWEDVYGHRREDVIGRTAYDFFPFDVAELQRKNDLEVQITNAATQAHEELFDIGGKHYSWNSFKFPLRTSSGQRLIGGIAIDITDAKRREEEHRSLERQLVKAQRMESVGTLASGIAHSFNNILGVIAGNADILANTEPGPELLKRRVAAIVKASERGANIVKQLLAAAGQTEIRHQAVDMNSVILDLIELLGETFPRTIVITSELMQELPAVIGDQGQLHQVLLNLCLNARDALPGGGTIRLGTRVASLATLRTRFPKADKPGYVVVSVQDNGIGIDESMQKRIFDPFFTTKETGQGMGLGLAVTDGIIEGHAGFVDLTSAPGSGTIFEVYLPFSAEEAVSHRPLRSPAPAFGGTETILFIEDEDSIREVASEMFPGFGYRMIFARDGFEGVEQFRRHRHEIALVISDYGLPEFDGEEVYRRIRELDPHVPFALVTGYITSEKHADLVARGVAATLAKPYKPWELLAIVRRVLDTTTI